MGKGREPIPDEKPVHHPDLYREQILTEQVRQRYALAPIGIVATIVNSLLTFFIMKDVLRYSLLVPWLAAILIITILRGVLVVRFRRVELDPATAKIWANRFLAGLVAIGAAWGSIGFLPFSELSLAHQVFIAFVLGGMAAGASSTFATVRNAYAAFSLPALVPLALHFFLMNDSFHYAMAAMTALFGLLLWRISKHNYAVNRMSLLLRFENREIIESLQRAKEAVEGLNAQLMAEIDAKLNAEAELRSHHEHLESVVKERTADLVAANQQLAAAKDAAEAASMAKSAFVANMSHEMRTPLAGVLGMIRLVLEMEIGDEERNLLKMAKRSADSLLRIISDVLEFSRLEAGMMSFEEKIFSITDVVKTAVEVVSLHALEKGLHLSWKVEDSVPEQVKGDDGRLRQVLVNLLGNSVKFTEHGQVEVTVRLLDDPAAAGRRFILFSIRDTGEGIPADQIEKIFGKFTQLDSSLTRRYGGTGIGLALTREIVEKMGGRIWAESSVGVGSTFYFTLPIVENVGSTSS
jgi:signal transduction histidine kinase